MVMVKHCKLGSILHGEQGGSVTPPLTALTDLVSFNTRLSVSTISTITSFTHRTRRSHQAVRRDKAIEHGSLYGHSAGGWRAVVGVSCHLKQLISMYSSLNNGLVTDVCADHGNVNTM